jgi:hypothetical protein
MKVLATILPVLIGAMVVAAEPVGAFQACKALPKAQQRAIARISGKGGKPLPEIWTIVVHEPKAQNGLREYTVTAGTVVATRGVSDLAQRLTPGDVVGLTGIKFDATQVAELAAAYAEANKLTPASLNYDLRKEGEDAAPLWKITALDEAGTTLGELVVTANTGALITQTGFSQSPEQKDLTTVAETEPADQADDEKPEKGATRGSAKSSGSSSRSGKKPDTFHRIGGHLQKFFTGKNTIGK